MSDVAFAGIARQAEMVRAGDVTPTELVELYLDRIDRLDPELNAYRIVLARPGARGCQAGRGAARGGRGRRRCRWPACRSRSRTPRTSRARSRPGARAASTEPAKADGEMVRRLRAAGRDRPRQDEPSRARDLRLHRDRGVGDHPQPVGHDPHARRVERRLGGRDRRRPLRGGHRVGRRGLDPHPRGALRPLRPEAPARPDLARAGTRALARALGRRLRHPDRRGLGALARRLPRRRSRRAAPARPFLRRRVARDAATPPHRLVHQAAPPRRARRSSTTRSPRARRGPRRRSSPSSGTRSSKKDPDWGLIGNNFTPRFLHGIKVDFDRVPHPDRLEDRTRGFARLGRLNGGRIVRRARRGEGKDARRILSIFERHRRPPHACDGRARRRGRALGGQSALRTVLGMSRTYPFTGPVEPPRATRPHRCPLGFTKTGLPAGGAARRPPERRDDPALSGGAARSRTPMGRPGAAGFMSVPQGVRPLTLC